MRNTNSIQVEVKSVRDIKSKVLLFKKLLGCNDIAVYITLRKEILAYYKDGSVIEDACVIEERLTDDLSGIEYRNQVVPLNNKMSFGNILIMKKQKYGE